MTEYTHPCDVTAITAEYIDCCLSDYFQGSVAEEVLTVPVYAGMTWKEAYKAAKDEFHASSGYFDQVDGSGTLAEDALHALFASFLMESPDDVADFVRYVEPDPDSIGETVFLYIALRAEID